MSDWSLYDRGFSLFPLAPNSKRPAVESWEAYQTARPSPDQVAAWARHHWNTGIATGAVSGCVVLDCDTLLSRMLAEGHGIPDTLTVATPRGWHFYFQHPGWPVSNRAGRAWTVPLDGEGVDGWDLRGDGGYVVGPGSYYVPTPDELAKGKVEGAYRIERDAPLAVAPDWLLALIAPRERRAPVATKFADVTSNYGRAALNAEMLLLTSAPEGERNNQINLSAFAIGQLVAGGEVTADEALGALHEALAGLGVADEEKAQGTLERGYEAGLLAPRGAEDLTPEAILGTRASIAPPPPVDGEAVTIADVAPDTSVRAFGRGKLILDYEMPILFADCYFVQALDRIFYRGMGLLTPTSFDTVFGGFKFPLDAEGSKTTRSAWEAFRTAPGFKCPIVADVCFRPDKPGQRTVTLDGRDYLNIYEPIQTPRIAGDPSKFIDLLARMLPVKRDREIFIAYMAALIQRPGRKFQWWPVLQGVKGNGKTCVTSILQFGVGQTYTHLVNPEAMGKTGNQFNSWVQGNLLVIVEEIFVNDQRHILETFKPVITNSRIALEAKGRDQKTGDNYANGLMCTNHKDGVPVSDDERRYAIFWTAQQSESDLARDGMAGDYFADLWDWLYGREAYAHLGENYGYAVCNNWLATVEINAEFNPAGKCQRAPETSSTRAAIRESLGTLEQEVLEAIEEQRQGFRGGWLSSGHLRTLFAGLRATISPKRFKAIASALGYVPHPAFQDGRVSRPLSDGSRPRLYAHVDSPAMALGATEAIEAYEAAQTGAVVEIPSNVLRFVPR